jgi:hypothetical protein
MRQVIRQSLNVFAALLLEALHCDYLRESAQSSASSGERS